MNSMFYMLPTLTMEISRSAFLDKDRCIPCATAPESQASPMEQSGIGIN